MKSYLRILGAVLGAAALLAPLHAETVYSDQTSFLAANPNVTTDDLSALTPYIGGNILGPIIGTNGITYSSSSGFFFVDGPDWYSLSNTTIRILDSAASSMTLSFTPDTDAVGFYFSSLFDSDVADIDVYGGSGLIYSGAFPAANSGAGNYFGISGTAPIAEITIAPEGNNYIDIGDVSNAVVTPEPFSVTLLGSGFALLLAKRRRKAATR